jgi:hypothetical protein
MLGAYLAWQIVRWIGPAGEEFWLAVPSAALAVALIGGHIDQVAEDLAGPSIVVTGMSFAIRR